MANTHYHGVYDDVTGFILCKRGTKRYFETVHLDMKARSKKRRSTGPAVSFKKRTFGGNQFIENPSGHSVVNDNSVPPTVPSTTRRKIEGSVFSILDEDNGMLNLEDPSSFHYILINSEFLSELFTLVGCCPDCAHRGGSNFK